MKNPPFNYHRPATVEAALALLEEHGDEAKILAGGQSLLPVMALRLGRPEHLIDIGAIAGLDTITVDDGVTIGALVRHAQAEVSADIARYAPVVAAAMPYVGHRAIRNRGTVVGSIAHADAAAEMPAVCLATNATMTIASSSGTRTVAAADFFQGYFTTSIEPNEMLTAGNFPAWSPTAGGTLVEVSRRHGDYAMVGLACMIDAPEGIIASASLAFFGVASSAIRVPEAEALLVGSAPSDEVFAAAAVAVCEALEPDSDIHATAAYRRHVAGVLTRKGLAEATSKIGSSAAANNATPSIQASPTPSGPTVTAASTPLGDSLTVTLTINGSPRDVAIDPRRSLADVIREDIGLTGTHLGCEHGVCGACTILVDGQPSRSCLMLAAQAEGTSITTIEGLATNDKMHPVQQAMHEAMSFQCAFCSPGFLMSTVALLRDSPNPTPAQIREELSGNLCRCTGYQSIIDGVETAVQIMGGTSA